MSGKNILWLVVAVVLVAGLALFMKSREKASWQSEPQGKPDKALADFPLNDITKIKVENKEKVLTLNKTAAGWEVVERENYPANLSQISSTLRTFWNLKPVQKLEAGESQYPALELAAPKAEKGGGTLIEFDKDQTKIASVILGKPHKASGESPYANGRYILVPDEKAIYVVTDTLEITPESLNWLNREFIQPGNAKSIQVSSKDGVVWEIVKGKDSPEWKFIDAKEKEKVDEGRVAGILNSVSSFADVAGKREKLKEQLADPRKVKLTTHDGFTYDFAVGAEKEGNRHVTVDVSAELPGERTPAPDEKPEDKAKLDEEFKAAQETLKKRLEKEKKYSEWVYLLPGSTLESFFKQRNELIATEPPPEAQPNPGDAGQVFSPMQMPPPGPPVPVPTQAPANP